MPATRDLFALPQQLQDEIYSHLDYLDIRHLSQTCRHAKARFKARVKRERLNLSLKHARLLHYEGSNYAKAKLLYTCRYCLRLRPSAKFADNWRWDGYGGFDARGRTSKNADKRFCIDCGVKTRTEPRPPRYGSAIVGETRIYSAAEYNPGKWSYYHPGLIIHINGMKHIYCPSCLKWKWNTSSGKKQCATCYEKWLGPLPEGCYAYKMEQRSKQQLLKISQAAVRKLNNGGVDPTPSAYQPEKEIKHSDLSVSYREIGSTEWITVSARRYMLLLREQELVAPDFHDDWSPREERWGDKRGSRVTYWHPAREQWFTVSADSWNEYTQQRINKMKQMGRYDIHRKENFNPEYRWGVDEFADQKQIKNMMYSVEWAATHLPLDEDFGDMPLGKLRIIKKCRTRKRRQKRQEKSEKESEETNEQETNEKETNEQETHNKKRIRKRRTREKRKRINRKDSHVTPHRDTPSAVKNSSASSDPHSTTSSHITEASAEEKFGAMYPATESPIWTAPKESTSPSGSSRFRRFWEEMKVSDIFNEEGIGYEFDISLPVEKGQRRIIDCIVDLTLSYFSFFLALLLWQLSPS
ncbi:hypothetical protein DM02DRAFT_624596 [Periconia macrospinosa]|uniref:F-box domain-containing protein n=1 Tax=Periconia macrospinosa TaxID=97972 RepID=A0A2V1E647_9PLEO|nr:hypothetical protein DM02DRAFT_624596 [Periconia macrospinosa]